MFCLISMRWKIMKLKEIFWTWRDFQSDFCCFSLISQKFEVEKVQCSMILKIWNKNIFFLLLKCVFLSFSYFPIYFSFFFVLSYRRTMISCWAVRKSGEIATLSENIWEILNWFFSQRILDCSTFCCVAWRQQGFFVCLLWILRLLLLIHFSEELTEFSI